MKCIQCDNQIEQIGTKPKLYCSDACRKAYKRANGQMETDKQQTDTPKLANGQTRELTPNEKQGLTTKNRCHGCDSEVSDLVCICQDCVKNDTSHKSLNIDIIGCE